MVKVSCQSSTVPRQKAQTNSGHPPASHSTAPSRAGGTMWRSEEHTSELQSRFDLVCRLLLEKKNDCIINITYTRNVITRNDPNLNTLQLTRPALQLRLVSIHVGVYGYFLS